MSNLEKMLLEELGHQGLTDAFDAALSDLYPAIETLIYYYIALQRGLLPF